MTSQRISLVRNQLIGSRQSSKIEMAENSEYNNKRERNGMETYTRGKDFINNLKAILKEDIHFTLNRKCVFRAPFRFTERTVSVKLFTQGTSYVVRTPKYLGKTRSFMRGAEWKKNQNTGTCGLIDLYTNPKIQRKYLIHFMSGFKRLDLWISPEEFKSEYFRQCLREINERDRKEKEKEKAEKEKEKAEREEKKKKKKEKEEELRNKKNERETEQKRGKKEEKEKEEKKEETKIAKKEKKKEKEREKKKGKKKEKEEKKKEKEEKKMGNEEKKEKEEKKKENEEKKKNEEKKGKEEKKKEREEKKKEKEEKKKEKEEKKRKEKEEKDKKKEAKKEAKNEKKEREKIEMKKRKETKKEKRIKEEKDEEDGQNVSEPVGRLKCVMCLCCCFGRTRD